VTVDANDHAVSDPRRTWYLGGGLMLASAVLGSGLRAVAPQTPWSGYLGVTLFAAALLAYAWGSGSVVARRPLGATALTVLAAGTAAATVLPFLFAAAGPPTGLGESIRSGYAATFLASILLRAVLLAAAVVAVVQIGRAAVVPRPWNWAPTWALAAVVLAEILSAILGALLIRDLPGAYLALGGVASLVAIAAPAFLGSVSIALAGRWRTSDASSAPDPAH
jgi:hypothetical protein